MQQLYDIHMDKLPGCKSFQLAVGPSGRSGVLAFTGPLDRLAVISLLLQNGNFSEGSAVRLMDKLEHDGEFVLLAQNFSNEQAAAFGWPG